MQAQAEYLRLYAIFHQGVRGVRCRRAGRDPPGTPGRFSGVRDGAFYVRQVADIPKGQHAKTYFALGNAGRRREGIAAVDRHLYEREQGWMIAALAPLHAATGARI